MKVPKQEHEAALDCLKKLVNKGDTVYGIVRSVARSGMSRTIDFYVFKDNHPVYLTGYMSQVLYNSRDKRGALKVAGTGMDMIFACVHDLSKRLFDDGYALKHDSL